MVSKKQRTSSECLIESAEIHGPPVKQLMLDASSNTIIISADDLADGVYLVTFNDGEKRISKKLIVSK